MEESPALSGNLHSICSTEAFDTTPHSSAFTFQNTAYMNGISVYYQNVRGLRTKTNELFVAISDAEFDVVVLSVTWLNNQFCSSLLFGNEYNVFRNDWDPDRTGKVRGGGVLIAVSNRLGSFASPVEVNDNIEQLWVNIDAGLRTVCLGVVYLPPDASTSVSSIDKLINSTLAVSEKLHPHDFNLLLGDFNQPGLSW